MTGSRPLRETCVPRDGGISGECGKRCSPRTCPEVVQKQSQAIYRDPVAPVRKASRASLIRAVIAEMSNGEVYYWYARMSPGLRRAGANNALKALRILLSGG